MPLAAFIGVDEKKMRLTNLDHWTLNLFLLLGRDVIAQCGIKRSTQWHTIGVFSVLFSGVTAWVNRQVSEDWIREPALLFSTCSCSKVPLIGKKNEPTCFS